MNKEYSDEEWLNMPFRELVEKTTVNKDMITVRIFKKAKYTSELQVILDMINNLDEGALSRFIFKKSGYYLNETDKEAAQSAITGYVYEMLIKKADEINSHF